MKKNKGTNKGRKKIVIISLLLIILIGFGIYYFVSDSNKDDVKVVRTIKNYNYQLNDNETELYNDTFERLEKILSKDQIDYEGYAKCISELYIIDFYTLTNKLSKNDIGGAQFVDPEIKDNFIEKARSTFYKYLKVAGDSRNQDLPEVSKITSVNVGNYSFKYSNKTVDDNAYKVSIKWSYKKDYGYEDSKDIILIKKENKLYIVETKEK